MHPQVAAINQAIVEAKPLRRIAADHSVSESAMNRHAKEHLPATLSVAVEAAEITHADQLLADLRALQARALGILDQAESAGRLRDATAAIREVRGCVELLGKLAGELETGTTVNVANIISAPEWSRLRSILLDALEEYPDARAAAGRALLEAENAPRR
ncbi:MAG TPA: hypothetical protein PKJ99_02445 [Thermoanaerobaculales bacterium]|nr:hypothetical protein [Thermoanaerobaculales bacterium]